jgi:hypothetical protein
MRDDARRFGAKRVGCVARLGQHRAHGPRAPVFREARTATFLRRRGFGEMADAALLASQRWRPLELPAAGFESAPPDLEQVVRRTLGRPA